MMIIIMMTMGVILYLNSILMQVFNILILMHSGVLSCACKRLRLQRNGYASSVFPVHGCYEMILKIRPFHPFGVNKPSEQRIQPIFQFDWITSIESGLFETKTKNMILIVRNGIKHDLKINIKKYLNQEKKLAFYRQPAPLYSYSCATK